MQNVNFHSIDDFFDFLPADELELVLFLRKIILECIPDCTEKLSYNVPYYRRHKNICFIWPGSVTWGNVKQNGVRLGFTSGHLLEDEVNYLNKGERKQVYWRDFYSIKEVDVELLKSYLFEAVIVDQENAKSKKKSR